MSGEEKRGGRSVVWGGAWFGGGEERLKWQKWVRVGSRQINYAIMLLHLLTQYSNDDEIFLKYLEDTRS